MSSTPTPVTSILLFNSVQFLWDETTSGNTSTNCIAASADGFGLFYSGNGQSWNQSDMQHGTFSKVAASNGYCLAASTIDPNKPDDTGRGIYYSVNGGINWLPSSITTGNFVDVAMNGNYAIAVSLSPPDNSYDPPYNPTFQGVYYSTRS